jgi:hypothetical protein
LQIADEEVIIPSPARPIWRAAGTPMTPAEMTLHHLIHLEEPVSPGCDWNEWFASRPA